ncbi:SAM-dependent methyltransferase [Alphaproteobacteria bacterium 46_93_T64]|nr:SAM-dependent methyltransferase [Alphaproteobacteria bacterium 46_93_T64]
MSNTDKIFSGSIPEFYDTYLVPLIFEDFAEDMADRVSKFNPNTVLEVAAGSGVVTRALAPKLDERSLFTVSDLNPEMLNHAESKQLTDNRISWQQADALNLHFSNATFDIVFCQFGVMFFPDRIAGYKEAKRVLKENGVFIFNVWDEISKNEFADTVTDAAARFFPDNPPQFLPRTPHGYYDIEEIENDVLEAGFSHVSIETLEKDCIASSANLPAIAYCHGTPLRNEIEARNPEALDQVTKIAAAAITLRFGEAPIKSKIKGHVITAKV